jgi:ferritin
VERNGIVMINNRVEQMMNEQIKLEIASSYLYLSMSAYFSSKGLDGMAAWMESQSQEELVHAMKFYKHITDRDGRVMLQPLEQPQAEWESPLSAWQAAYKHEQFITGKINELTKLAHQESDFAALPMLGWFVDEQIEEEASTSKVVQSLEMVGTSGQGMLMLDRELGTRVFTYPTTTKEGE